MTAENALDRKLVAEYLTKWANALAAWPAEQPESQEAHRQAIGALRSLAVQQDPSGTATASAEQGARHARWKRPARCNNLDDMLDDVQVHGPGEWQNDQGPDDWWAVSTGDDGIIAYFANEADACRFRLDLINYWLNG